MDTTATQADRMSSFGEADFVYEALKGAGAIGDYLQDILADTVYYAGKYIAYVRDAYLTCQGSLFAERIDESKISLVRMVRGDADIDDGEKREFYLHFGRDLVTATKSGLESDTLTIIDLSRYEL
ncbi:MAG: hypothetical protein WCP29_02260 [Acidobacteriota bacterium]